MTEELQILNELLKIQKNFIQKNDFRQSIIEIFQLILKTTNSSLGFIGEYINNDNNFIDFIADNREEYLKENSLQFYEKNGEFWGTEISRSVLINNCKINKTDKPCGYNWLIIPITFGEEIIGLCGIADKNINYSLDFTTLLEPLTINIAHYLSVKKIKEIHKIAKKKLLKKESYLSTLNNIAGLLMTEYEIFPWQTIVEELGKATGICRITLLLVETLKNGKLAAIASAEWCDTNVSSEIKNAPFFLLNENTQRWFDILSNGEIIEISVSQIPEEAIKNEFIRQKIKSLLVIPILLDDVFYGFLGFDNCVEEKEWPVDEKEYLITATEYISQAIKRKNIEIELNKSEEKFRTFADFTYDMEYWANPSGKMLYVSNACKRITGYDKNELINAPNFSKLLIYPEDSLIYSEHLKKYHTITGNPNESIVEFRIITKDNSVKWIQHGCNAVYNAAGVYIGRRVNNRDITKMKQAEEQLKANKEKNKALLNAIPDLMFLYSHTGYFLECWCSDKKMLFKPVEEFVNQKISKVLPQKLALMVLEKIDLVMKENIMHKFEYSMVIDNKERFFESRSVKCGEDKVLSLIREITEQKKADKELIKAKEQAEQADKMKTQFLAQMSHEIRTPINAILSLNSLIKEEVKGKVDDDVFDLYQSIESAGRRLIRTIDLLLNMSEVQTGVYDAKFSSFNPMEIIHAIVKEMDVIAKQKNLKLNLTSKYTEAEIYGDQYSVAQIIVNLLDNAIKYTKTGQVDIELNKNSENDVSIVVKDTGIGIKKEFIPKLFDPFSQEEEGYIRSFEGTGLGLALVKRYCDINNATIEVISEKGEGTKVEVGFSSKKFDQIFINN
ncbi:MAG: ATP-binding protein [bacterium]